MAIVRIFHGRVSDDGTMLSLLDNEKPMRDRILARLAGKTVDLTLKVHREQRSVDQNAWHWGVAIPVIAEALGYDLHEYTDLHYALVDECFGTHLDQRVGRIVPDVRSSQLDTAKFSEFMEWEVRWAAQRGVLVPLPNESEAA